jgi:predicted acyl esterase
MKKSREESKILKGVFYDSPVQGLEYQTQTISGITNEKGEFKYRPGETVTFSVGGLVLGSARGRKRVTPADLVVEVGGEVKRIKNQKVTNISRFLQSLDEDGNVENGITITDESRNTVRRYRYRINFDQTEAAFTADQNVTALFGELGATLRTGPQARNHLYRTLNGVKKITDVKIPTRDGSYLSANIFRPIEEGKYPTVMSLGAYGKDRYRGVICNQADLLEHEETEDRYFQGNPVENLPLFGKQMTEAFELANTMDWVPRGYVVVRVDGRGAGKSPGVFEQFSLQEAKDYYDAIEWAAKQPWSNGNVGLFGSSYYAMDQYNVAQLQPPSLKAMIPVAGDIDSYRDYIYCGGGLYNDFNFVSKAVCGEWKGVEWVSIAQANPFDDPNIYGPTGSLCISPDMSKVIVPFHSGMGIEGCIHTRGSSEAYILAASKHKKLTIISEPPGHGWSYAKEFLEDDIAFFDYWLKGIDNGIMDKPPVNMMIRTGWGGYYWQSENEWPIARTKYTKYYLDATPSRWEGDGRRKDFLRLQANVPAKEMKTTYSAEVDIGTVPPDLPSRMPFAPRVGGDPPWSYGISFVTEPLPEDMVLAGYIKLVLWVSSTSYDMQIHATVRVVDENSMDVPYKAGNTAMFRLFPVAWGALKVSHRKLDPAKSTIYRPWHTHLKKDYQPLTPGEIVEAEVEIWPTTALIRKGHRIRLNVQPANGEGIMGRIYDLDEAYQRGASNTIYTGPDYPSYLQLPVIPPKQ